MTPEIVRRLIDGVWRTVEADASSNGGSGIVLKTNPVVISSAAIKALKTSPPTIIAAPGAGKAILPFSAFFVYTAGVSGYTTAGHLMLTTQPLITANPGFTSSLLELSGFGGTLGTSDLVFSMNDATFSDITSPQVTPAQVENQPVKLYCNDSNPTVGDGTMTVQVWYTLADI